MRREAAAAVADLAETVAVAAVVVVDVVATAVAGPHVTKW